MPHDLKSLGIDRMSIEDRLDLMHAIWESIPPPRRLTPEQHAELDRRLAKIDAGQATFIPYEQVRAELDAEFGK